MKALLAAIALCLTVGFGFAQADATMAIKQKPRIMFTLSAKSGSIHKVSTGRYILSIPKDAVTKTTAFSSVPGKGEKAIKIADLQHFWTSKVTNNFTKNPPNTTLYFAGLGKQVVVVATHLDVNGALINIKLKTKKPLSTGAVKKTSIVFDGWGCLHDDCTKSCNLDNPGCWICYQFWIAPPPTPCAECKRADGTKCVCRPGAITCPNGG